MPDLIKSNYLFSFIVNLIRKNSLFDAARRIFSYLRRVFLIGRILKYAAIAVSVIETGAAFIVSAALVLAAVPLTIAALAVFAAADRIIGSRLLRSEALKQALEQPKVYVIGKAGGFGDGFAQELANSGAAVFVICADPSKKFICLNLKNGVFYVRHAFYFRLKRRCFSDIPDKLTYLL